eukprot:CAMPEP_0119548306 /NCGR_PEP_ID=MMETSP1352-20130426/2251_1 /TAXON_ID=265584 /ORGANISM="Stauroneis constricta, Strain CCMP1120" /LENGTH=396 /DNA_ID=CAMNT_0007593531 /DNA_START=252 /DNA_END=1442 /DNA_ORIENTATION=+
MKLSAIAITAAMLCMQTTTTDAFTIPTAHRASFKAAARTPQVSSQFHSIKLYSSSSSSSSSNTDQQVKADDEIERLQSMAAKLRAEASALEADRAQELAKAAENAFQKFDTNKDGEVTFDELKAGLEKVLKTELPEKRVRKLMEDFDVSGDGALQLDEFVGMDKFRNKLEALAREEKKQALDAAKEAQLAAEKAVLAQAKLELINDQAPSGKDKILSVLPYLFPLMDSLQFGRFLVMENQDNPLVIALALLYTLYRSIPFSGFVSFLVLNVLSGNPGLNRLVRFNMQQAIFLDIALFFPGLLAAVFTLVLGGAGVQIPPGVTELGSDVIFGTLLVAVAYCTVSSLLGVTPNKLPLISKAVEDRTLSADMFDDVGTFIPRDQRKNDDDKDDKKKDDK